MDRRALGILLIVAVVLLPTWAVAIQPVGDHAGPVEIDAGETDMRPGQALLDTPTEFTPAQVGVIIWIALGLLTAALAFVHRRMHGPDDGEDAPADAAPWFRTDHRWIAEYVPPTESAAGLYVVLGLIAASVALSVLTVVEFQTLARTQYVGLYVGGIFFTLAGATAAYSAYFLPDVTVAEERYHG
jgi:hypothetical protein